MMMTMMMMMPSLQEIKRQVKLNKHRETMMMVNLNIFKQ
jgi:hypothetical protein